jgi:hypothetical protein
VSRSGQKSAGLVAGLLGLHFLEQAIAVCAAHYSQCKSVMRMKDAIHILKETDNVIFHFMYSGSK